MEGLPSQELGCPGRVERDHQVRVQQCVAGGLGREIRQLFGGSYTFRELVIENDHLTRN